MDGIAYLHFNHCFNLQVAAPSADATLLASIVANLSTETVPARGLRVKSMPFGQTRCVCTI
jgi:hypothetical protein